MHEGLLVRRADDNRSAVKIVAAATLIAGMTMSIPVRTYAAGKAAQNVGQRIDNTYGHGTSQGTHQKAPRSNDMNKGAKSSKAQEMMGIGLNLAAAGMFASECSATPSCSVCCVMAASSLTQAVSLGSAAGKTQKAVKATQNDSSGTGTDFGMDNSEDPIADGPTYGGAGTGSDGPAGFMTPEDSQRARTAAGQLADAGFKVDTKKGTVTLPNGKTVPLDQIDSPEEMKAQGFSSQAIQAGENMRALVGRSLQARLQALGAQAKSGSLETEGGGGGGRGTANNKDSEQGSGFNPNGLFGDQNKKTPPSVSGLSKQMGDSKIGVPQDNIFHMVSRQYTKQEGSSQFLLQRPIAPLPK